MTNTTVLDAGFGARLEGYGTPADLLDEAVIAQCRAALSRWGVLVIEGAHFDDETQVAFSRAFGAHGGSPGGRELSTISMDKRVNKLAEYLKGAFNWHLDDTTSDVPSRATMLTARQISPDGGGTQFANTYLAWEELPTSERRRYTGLRVVHSFEAAQRQVKSEPSASELASWRTVPTHESSLVWQHADGRHSLVIGATADHIVGVSAAESEAILADILAWSTQPHFVYTHQWAIGDAVLWDNTAVLHRALPYDLTSDRMLRRTHIRGQEAWA